MTNLEKFRKLNEEYSKLADFAIIYIAEAHPEDGWSVKNAVRVQSHKNLEERRSASRKMLELSPQTCRVLVDGLEDEASIAYAALPDRLYIVQEGAIVYQGGMGPFKYKINEIEDWLMKYSGKE